MLPGRPCCQQVTKIPQIMWLTAAIRLNFHLADDRHTEKKRKGPKPYLGSFGMQPPRTA